jgi:hypothetical protein
MSTPNIKSARIRWWEQYGNNPEVELVVDDAWSYKPYSESVHRVLMQDDRGTLYFASDGDFAHFVFVAEVDGQHHQFKGASTGDLLTEEGHIKVSSGWSSRAGVVNQYLPHEDHIMDVPLYGGQSKSGRAGVAVKVSKVAEFLPEGVYIVRKDDGDITYYPSVDPQEVKKP